MKHEPLIRHSLVPVLFICITSLSPLASATWKNLCPDYSNCPTASTHYINPSSANKNKGEVTLTYFYQTGFIEDYSNLASRLLVSSSTDQAKVPDWDSLIQPGGAFMRHSNGNWVVMRGFGNVHTFDSSGQSLGLTRVQPTDTLIAGWFSVEGPILEDKGSLYFSQLWLSGGFVTLFSSNDTGKTWNRTDLELSQITSPLYQNPFGHGFLIVGQQSRNKPLSRGLFKITPLEDNKVTRMDSIQPITHFDAQLNTISFDFNPVNANHPVIYAATNKGIFTSSNKGLSWVHLEGLTEPVDNLAVVYDAQPRLIVASTKNSGILASKDEGKTWIPFAHGLLDGKSNINYGTVLPSIHYMNGQLLVRTQGGWYRCADFNCEGTATIAPPVEKRGTIPVVEFYNSALDHYFITSDNDEITRIEGGQAGLNWSRTGFTFTAWTPLGLNTGKAVCRFYGSTSPGPNSHFFSASADECDSLHQLQKSTPADKPRWNFEGLPFMVAKSRVASAEECAQGHIPIYRAYNNGYARGIDSNHRFVADHAEIDKLVTQGWADEGIAFCALP